MADANPLSISTPNSSSMRSTAVKDRICPYCHQSFTSSSLGRHLDLFIKEKNPKTPDDLHNVDEIRKLRGSITRRQSRKSGRLSNATSPNTKSGSTTEDNSPVHPEDLTPPIGGSKPTLPQPGWQVTGVMNDVPPPQATEQPMWTSKRAAPSRTVSQEDGIRDRKDQIHRGRAAEYALKEVLESVKAARLRSRPSTPFDFNFFSLSLPQLYLRCLTPPVALLSKPSPHPTELSWPLDPPTTAHCEMLRGWLASKLANWRMRREQHAFPSNLSNGIDGISREAEKIRQEEAMYYEHLNAEFQKWSRLDDEERHRTWQLECARAYVTEQESHKATLARLEEAEQEIDQLRIRITQLISSDPHLQRAALLPSSTPAMPRGTALQLLSTDADQWDVNDLVSKWQTRLDATRTHPPPPQPPFSYPSFAPRTQTQGSTEISPLSPPPPFRDPTTTLNLISAAAALGPGPLRDTSDDEPMQSPRTYQPPPPLPRTSDPSSAGAKRRGLSQDRPRSDGGNPATRRRRTESPLHRAHTRSSHVDMDVS